MLNELLLGPLIGVGLLLIIPYNSELFKPTVLNKMYRFIGIAVSGFIFLASVELWSKYETNLGGFRFTEKLTWFSPVIDKNVYLFIDGISLVFILLTTVITLLVMLSLSYNIGLRQHKFYKTYFICIFLIEFSLLMAFMVADILFFYIFFESILVPMFFIIGIWGSGSRKIKAGYYFFLYTFVGSLFMLVGIIILFLETGSTNFFIIASHKFNETKELFLWLCLFLSFAVKIPLFPFHIWLPEAHVEAPTDGSVILAALLLKLGGYGMIRFLLVFFPAASAYFSPFVYTLAVLGMTYASLTALRQVDMKRIIAYASVAHMNFSVLGIFAMNVEALTGAVFLMFAHGLVSSALFFLVGILYRKYGSRLIYYYGGLAQTMPLFTFFFLFFSFSNAGLPGTANFVGEILIFLGLGGFSFITVILTCLGFILSVVYSLWLCNRLCFGNLRLQYITFFSDINRSDFFILGFLFFLTLVFGVYPQPLLHTVAATAEVVVHQQISNFS